MLKAIKELLSDANGQLSTTRVSGIEIVNVVLAVFVAQNVVSMCAGKGFIDMGTNCLAAIGLAFVLKGAQNFTEKKAE
jgi:hypothetical protein